VKPPRLSRSRPGGAVARGAPQTFRLRQWLRTIDLDQYASLLAEHDIDDETVAELTESDLEKLGISVGHRKKIIKAMAAYRSTLLKAKERPGEPQQLDEMLKPERRQLTVLFCDVVGSTTLSTQLDPEDLRDVLHEFQGCCGQTIRRYEGHIARLMGDGVLAYFGFPIAHEDDAERAVNAALEMVELIATMSTCAVQPLQIRIGIATGLVVVGDFVGEGPGREFTLVGEAPNLAARLQQLAKPNQILVAPHTKRLLGRLFELEDLGPRDIKGLDQRVPVWRVIKRSAIGSRFEARQSLRLTPLVGRQSELATLLKHYNRAKRGPGQVVLISGEPGVGKSRLIMALRNLIAGPKDRLLSLQCSSYHATSAWYPLIRLLDDECGINRDTPPTLRLEKLERFVDRYLRDKSTSIVPLLAALLSVPISDCYSPLHLTPEQQKDRTFTALLDLFEARAKKEPVLLVFEDVQWIDPTSLELLQRLRDRACHWRILIVLLFRPELTLPWMDQAHVSALTVHRLKRTEVASMIDSLVDPGALSPTVIDEIAAKSDGVPLFIEEMTKAVLELRRPDQTGALTELPATFCIPATLHDSLMARLDQLSFMKTVAQAAAAIGREFSLDLLEAIAPLSRRDVHAAVDRLLASGLVYRNGPLGNRTYTFKHALVRDEAYASLLRDERQSLDVRIAEALCTKFAPLADAAPEIVAQHFARAGRSQSAIEYWRKAAGRASARSAYQEAGTHLRAALDLLDELPASRDRDQLELQLQQSLGSALAAQKGFNATETVDAFHRALKLCRQLPESPETLAALNRMITVHVARGEFEQSRELAGELLARARWQKDSTPQLMGHRALGMSLFLVGELAEAREQLRRALELYDEERHAPLALVFSLDFKAAAGAYLVLTSVLLGDIDRGLAYGRDAVAHAERLGHPHSICYALLFLAGALVLCRDAQAARSVNDRVMPLASEYGFSTWLAGSQMLEGWTLVELGDIELGIDKLRGSIDALEATASTWMHFARYLLSEALGNAGQPERALEMVEEMLRQIAGTRGRWYEADVHRIRGDLLVKLGAPSAAESCYQDAIAIATRQGARLWQLRATTGLATLWRSQGKVTEMRARLAALCAAFGNEAMITDVQLAKALIGRLPPQYLN
jgi:class 3 adenylate cyclase/predicted ATPase